ncbi:MAG: helix-turn-helix domain-containing protein [Candidatus Omnitrophica bacterium]|nr:helix-turn-helix domain-containing protein [Candidatus Omnitrophota bacterium]MBU1996167.1 helix-turn-helix domain-containing protein [Candidatus Omnitrophota bacterium]
MNNIAYYKTLSPEERLERVCEILVRGMYVLAQKKGWIEKPKFQLAEYPPKPRKKLNWKESLQEDLKNYRNGREVIEEEKIYSVSQTAEILNLSKKTVFRWIKGGKIKAVKQLNGYYKISQREIGLLMAKSGI